ncbi:MAG: bifunctional enoyl-CoA hydratase/phosphate acetyltransferase [Planctomycetes bacterium]|nr:bifunctional enoyl-CoA hydratase/phosphate acetyltransferase [Planctomycetota bacterium]
MGSPRNFTDVIAALSKRSIKQTVALASAATSTGLSAMVEAHGAGFIDYLLFGPRADILKTAEENSLDIDESTIRDCADGHEACRAAVQAVANNEACTLMKGDVHTKEYLKAVLDRDRGLRGPGLMSHVFIWERLSMNKFVFVSDAALNIAPDLQQKVAITENAIEVAHVFGVDEPKVALLASVETVNPKMPATLEAAIITQMARRKQIHGKAVIDGPLALDNAISPEAARVKGIDSPVAGYADILITPDIEAGNMLAKAYPFLVPGAEMAGVVVGAKKPVIITSRADSMKSKLYSIAAAAYLSTGVECA